MASKKTKTPADDDNFDELFDIGEHSKAKKPSATKGTKTSKPKTSTDKDILADLESELKDTPSRPHTPRLKDTAAKRAIGTPPAGDVAARKSTDSARSLKASFTPSATSSELPDSERKAPVEQAQAQEQAGGSWWGGFSSLASGVMKQAETAYKELQQNEEAKKWAEQVKGLRENLDLNTLQSYGKPSNSYDADSNM